MNRIINKRIRWVLGCSVLFLLLGVLPTFAAINGVTGPNFNLTASAGYISTADGNYIYMWGYGLNGALMQYPGPTLIVNQGDVITVTLTNQLTVPVSILFPGQERVSATGGAPGLLTREAPAGGGTVNYTFTAAYPGTYTYYSGTRPDLQIEMGLVGALIVRPAGVPNQAYSDPDSQFDHEYLFLLSEIDPGIHDLVEWGWIDFVDTTTFFPVYWLSNGRTGPDTMFPDNIPWLPHQPYGIMPMMHPGEKLLMRLIGGGRDFHPFHTHGNHTRIIAVDGRLLESSPGTGAGADLSEMVFTNMVVPGSSMDALFTWTGEKLGWDMYGHEQDIDNDPAGNFPGPEDIDHNGNGIFDSVPIEPNEYAPDHGKPFPTKIPDAKDLTFGQFYSGSPFLGAMGALPPGEGGFNPNGGFAYMWHSHAEKELTNYDIFPGGMLTMIIVEHPSVPLMNP